MHSGKPKVSICVVTYNHEKYIRQCLQSLLDQETNFPFEVIVADDCSRDGTREIVQEYAERYPHIVRPFLHSENIGAARNYTFVHEQAQGEYIAHVDGDDYALPGKLQAQADYLDAHPECNIAWHRMKLLNVQNDIMVDDLIDLRSMPAAGFSRRELIRFLAIGLNSAKMYRAAVRDIDLPGFPIMDTFINIEQIGNGVAAFVGKEPLGVYRVGIGVASAGNMTKKVLNESFLYLMKKYPQHKGDVGFAASVLLAAALKNRQWQNARLFLPVVLKGFRFSTPYDIWAAKDMLAMFRWPREVRAGGKP